MLEVSNLSRSYGDFLAVDDVSFTIQKGEIIGLLGHNGAGKTTIMKMISGYLEPDEGSVVVDQLSLSQSASAIQRTLGYLPESLPIYAELTVAEYLNYAADFKGLCGEYRNRALQKAILSTDIQSKLLDPIHTLSRGFKQRVGVAQAILGDPKLLILDEPTNGLDPTQTEHMRTLICDLAKNATVILSTHIMQEVEAICDRVLIINSGKLVVDKKLQELREGHHVRVVTSLKSDEMKKVLSDIEHVERFDELSDIEGDQQYLLSLNHNTRDARAEIVEKIIQANGHLFNINTEQRDLEGLFREVSRGHFKQEEMKNAA